jgi:hypothetical protein
MKESRIPGAVVCIDEGQRIDGRAMSAIKNALQHSKSYLIILSLRLVTDEGGADKAGRLILDTKAASEAEGDIGASRFYVTGVPIGPFDTDQEAAQCIRRRLIYNTIAFDDDVISRIARIAGRIPKNMIRLSNNVYSDAQNDSTQVVNVALLNHTFDRVYRSEVVEAVTVLDSTSAAATSALRGLLELRQPATAAVVTTHLYPSATGDLQTTLTESVQSNLDRLCKVSGFVIRTQDRFGIPGPVHAYALELALERR